MIFLRKKAKKELNLSVIPNHVAIIMDGNGRWAKMRGKPRDFGHKVGSENVKRVVEHAFKRGVKVVSLYAFSCENWSRPKEEVEKLFSLIKVFLDKYIAEVKKNGVKIVFSGDTDSLPDDVKKSVNTAKEYTDMNGERILNIALNYGSRQEIVYAVNKLVENHEPVTVESIPKYLYTADLGDPELVIRTSGELRLSNFMLYQLAYSELYFTNVLWPDFDENEFDKALVSFANRKRRFGGINEK